MSDLPHGRDKAVKRWSAGDIADAFDGEGAPSVWWVPAAAFDAVVAESAGTSDRNVELMGANLRLLAERDAVVAERDEARAWVRHLKAERDVPEP